MILIISPKYGLKSYAPSLIKAAKLHNINTITFANSFKSNSEIQFPVNEKIALYGESSFCEFIAQELQLNIISNSVDWITKVPQQLLKRSVKCMTLRDILLTKDESRKEIHRSYLEPTDDAWFQPGVYEKSFPDIHINSRVIVQTDVKWQIKYRFVIVAGKIETYCCYRIGTVFNQEVIYKTKYRGDQITSEAFMQTVLSHCTTAPSCVIDVGYIEKTGWAIVGSYPIWSSDLYGCNPEHYLKALFVAAQPIN